MIYYGIAISHKNLKVTIFLGGVGPKIISKQLGVSMWVKKCLPWLYMFLKPLPHEQECARVSLTVLKCEIICYAFKSRNKNK